VWTATLSSATAANPRRGCCAAADLDLDLSRSWMIGDIAADIHAGRNAGCTTILFAQYCDREKEIRAGRPHFVADTFAEVERIICGKGIGVFKTGW
jgi:phosphoglycolate phosphatase-like HAD superfamily hydrolase